MLLNMSAFYFRQYFQWEYTNTSILRAQTKGGNSMSGIGNFLLMHINGSLQVLLTIFTNLQLLTKIIVLKRESNSEM
jgi:hypothetical protein